MFGMGLMPSFYIATALTFSSTIIVVKILSDKREMHSLYAKFSLGILLAQDIVAIGLLMFLSGFNAHASSTQALINFLLIFLKGGILVGIVIFLSKKVFPRVIESITKSPETLFFSESCLGIWSCGSC